MKATDFVLQQVTKEMTIKFAKVLRDELDMHLQDLLYKIANATDEAECRHLRANYRYLVNVLNDLGGVMLDFPNTDAPDISDIDLDEIAKRLNYQEIGFFLSRLRYQM